MNKFKTLIVVFVSFILQITVFSKVDIFGANINLIIAMTIALSLTLGPKTGAYSGLIVGLLEDLMFADVIGIRALSYFLIGTFVGNDRLRFKSDKNTGLLLSFVFTFINFLFVGLITYLFKGDLQVIKNYLFIPVIIEAILNTVIYLIYHLVVNKIMYIPTYRI
ncbi:rod shape-determining protein MreD [Anaerococcus sp. AGMB00486]|uniref:Rod shape-determining protein MreD n=2 Tax=Anaerococcus TaxID=165779 RepID=A0ABX2N8L0_9FIRM|nr:MULTISPECIES: rod shape-determining protein MreD [Anaerococcus]MSS77185.1 rod shape-determining protein MreD [Anaerococcus porci]NVF11010.1 rod shape-determining protein MreD [Anaerococcus faecalis]